MLVLEHKTDSHQNQENQNNPLQAPKILQKNNNHHLISMPHHKMPYPNQLYHILLTHHYILIVVPLLLTF